MADDNRPSLDVDIKINSDTAGAEQAKQALRGIGQEAETMGGHGASGFGKLVQGGRAAHGAMMGLNTAMQGGVGIAIGLSRALNDVFILVRSAAASSGPFILLALAIGAVLGVMRGLMAHAHGAADGMKHAADSAHEFKKALADADAEAKRDFLEINKDAKALAVSFREVNDALAEGEKRAKALFAAEKELASANLTMQEAKELAALDPKAADYAQRKAATELKFKGLRTNLGDNFAQAELENEVIRARLVKDAMTGKLGDMRNLRLRAGETADVAGVGAAGATQDALSATTALRRQPFVEDAGSSAGNFLRSLIPGMSPRLPVDSSVDVLRQREHEAVLRATAAQEKARKEKAEAEKLVADQEKMREEAEKKIADADTTLAVGPLKLATLKAKAKTEVIGDTQAVNTRLMQDRDADAMTRGDIQKELDQIHGVQTSGFQTSFGNPAYARAVERASALEKQLEDMTNAQNYRDQLMLEQLSNNARQAKKTAKQLDNMQSVTGGP